MKLRQLALPILLFLFFSFLPFASAYVSISGDHQFYYLNGTSFQNPGNYINVTLVDNVWSFNGTAYSFPSPSPAPTATPLTADDAVGIAIAVGIIAIALAVCMPIIMQRRKREEY
jgi:hypothetical protein